MIYSKNDNLVLNAIEILKKDQFTFTDGKNMYIHDETSNPIIKFLCYFFIKKVDILDYLQLSEVIDVEYNPPNLTIEQVLDYRGKICRFHNELKRIRECNGLIKYSE